MFEDVAFDEPIPHPFATGRGGHDLGGDFTGADVGELGSFLGLANVFAGSGVEVHRGSRFMVSQIVERLQDESSKNEPFGTDLNQWLRYFK